MIIYIVPLVICIIFGPKALSSIRYSMLGDDNAKVRIIDVIISISVAVIPAINVIVSILSVVFVLLVLFISSFESKEGLFNKKLFGGKDDENK